jgi:4-amino-4-deoxychorismate lyase
MQKLFFETVRIEGGVPRHLPEHNRRLNRTRAEIFGAQDRIDLRDHIAPPPDHDGILRCRILYGNAVEAIEYLPYTPRERNTFALIRSAIAYPHKALDRSELDALFARRGAADDILIVSPEGFLRDTSIANIALKIDGRWLTPEHPLLPGTVRARLLAEGKITTTPLRREDLTRAEAVAVLNAMVGFHIVENPRFIEA